MIADPAHEGEAGCDLPNEALIIGPELATEMLGQRQIVGVVGRRQTEGVGEDERLKVQPCRVAVFNRKGEEVVELVSRIYERESGVGSHALTEDVGCLNRQ